MIQILALKIHIEFILCVYLLVTRTVKMSTFPAGVA